MVGNNLMQSRIFQSLHCANGLFMFNLGPFKFQSSLLSLCIQPEKISVKTLHLLSLCF